MPQEARFITDLDTRTLSNGEWLLLNDLVFYSKKFDGYLVAPVGFQTNLASIPQIVHSIFPKQGKHDKAAVIHDAGYGNALITLHGERIYVGKDFSDELFLEGMLAEGVPNWRAKVMYFSVHKFGDAAGHPLASNAPS